MAVTAAAPAALTEKEVRALADRWYAGLSRKDAPRSMLGMLLPADLEMTFPEATVRGPDEFKAWYRGVRRRYFDQVHTVRRCAVRLDGARAEVSILVRWEASTWRPPRAFSQRIVADAGQTWTVVRPPEGGAAVIQRYRVDTFTPVEGPGR